MGQAVIQEGQTLMDLAVEHRGAWEASIDMAITEGVSLTATPPPGRSYRLPSRVYDKVMQAHCKAYRVSPATLRDMTDRRWRIFAQQFTQEFD